MSDRPHLWTFRRCPYAIRARLALDVAEVDVEYREIVLRDKPAEMLAESPKGTVPVCVLPGGRVLDESLDIMRWALARHDPEHWLPESGLSESASESTATDELLEANDAFKPSLDRYKYFNRHPEETREPNRQKCRAHLAMLDERLGERPFLVAERFTLADAALLPFVRQFHFCDTSTLEEWGLHNVRRWLDDFLATDRFARVMVKRPLWLDRDR